MGLKIGILFECGTWRSCTKPVVGQPSSTASTDWRAAFQVEIAYSDLASFAATNSAELFGYTGGGHTGGSTATVGRLIVPTTGS